MLIATGFGLGYLPKAPGTWGSLGGVAIWVGARFAIVPAVFHWDPPFRPILLVFAGMIVVALLGLWASTKACEHLGQTDPQQVVIDEISGQMLALAVITHLPIQWKYLLLGFILFRVFDIWKPWPARAAEKLPGGWGIMADDWVAGLYAALGLWIVRALGL